MPRTRPVIFDLDQGPRIRPVHPGRYLDYHLLEMRTVTATGIETLSMADAARRAGISPRMLSHIRTGAVGISARTALALARLTGIAADTWMATQALWDLHQERERLRLRRKDRTA
jgi:addiction module HigA family antidote